MTSRLNAVLAVTTAAPLAYLYLVFLSWLVSNRVLAGVSYIEAGILVTQLMRLVMVVSVRRFRTASAAQIWNIFSLEILSLPILVVLYFWLGDPYMLSLFIAITIAWPSALLCVLPGFVIYRFASSMARGQRLVATVPPAVALFAFFAFVTHAISSQPVPSGLAGVSSLLLSALVHARSVQITPQVVLAGIPLYLSLVTYSTIRSEAVSPGRNAILSLIAFVTLIAIGLEVFAVHIAVYQPFAFAVPGALLVTVIWWMTRAR